MTREEIILERLPAVRYHAIRLRSSLPPGLDVDDLVQEGTLGLIRGVDAYDASGGASLKSYVEHRIIGAMLDSIRRLTGSVARPRPVLVGVMGGAYDDGEGFEESQRSQEPDPEEAAQSSELAGLVRRAVETCALTERERYVLQAYFVDGLEHSAIARLVGLCESRVSQIKRAALRRLSLSRFLTTKRVAA